MKPKEKINDLNSNIRVLTAILNKTDGLVKHLDSQVNILLGISYAICLFSASQVKDNEWWLFFLVISIFSGVASFVSLLAIHPPKFMRKRNQKESLMYNKKITDFKSADAYSKKIENILKDEGEITKQFSTEIYNLSKYYYRPKRNLFHVSRNILFWGLALSLLAFLIDMLYKNFF